MVSIHIYTHRILLQLTQELKLSLCYSTLGVTDLYHPTPSTKTTLQELYPTTNPDTETDPGATVERKLAVQTREAIAWALLFLVALLFSGLLFINVILFLKYKHEQRRNSTAQAPAYDLADNPCYESSKISNTLETNIYEQVETCENA